MDAEEAPGPRSVVDRALTEPELSQLTAADEKSLRGGDPRNPTLALAPNGSFRPSRGCFEPLECHPKTLAPPALPVAHAVCRFTLPSVPKSRQDLR
jgi:hypothetical protein